MQVARFFKLKRFIPVSDSGFTLIELMVTSFLGLIVLALTLSATTANRRLYKYDLVRTKVNQNLRSALDIIGIDVRQAGENLFSTFPAIEIINGAAGSPDELIVRRNLRDEVFNLCQPLAAGSGNTTIYVADNSQVQPGCDTTSNASAHASWSAYRIAEGGSVNAYIYNRVTREGEFFVFTAEGSSASQYTLTRTAGTWQHQYDVGASSIYILEEWRYRLQNGVLQIITDQDTANPLNVVDGVSAFQVVARMQDGTTSAAFAPGDDWSDIQSLQFNLTGIDRAFGEDVVRTLTAEFFPRNILSN